MTGLYDYLKAKADWKKHFKRAKRVADKWNLAYDKDTATFKMVVQENNCAVVLEFSVYFLSLCKVVDGVVSDTIRRARLEVNRKCLNSTELSTKM